jgi:tryptophan-rich sensory protein
MCVWCVAYGIIVMLVPSLKFEKLSKKKEKKITSFTYSISIYINIYYSIIGDPFSNKTTIMP